MSAHSRSARFMAALAGGVSIFALGYTQPVMAQQAAQADQPAAAGGAQLEEIVVTARRKEEKAQTVPITIQTMNQDQLSDQDIHVSFAFEKATPGLQATNGSSPLAQHIWIRGITSSVAYWDGAPDLLTTGYDMFFDVGSIQLLKGPQGTLFGIATTGGAVVVEPKHPTDNFEGYVSGTVGNYNRTTEALVVNVPVVEDKVLLRIGGEKSHTDGYVYDISRGVDLNDVNYAVGRVMATIRPTDDLSNEFSLGDYVSNPMQPFVFVETTINTIQPSLSAVARSAFFPQIKAVFDAARTLGHYAIIGDDVNGNLENLGQQWNMVNTTAWDVNDDLEIKNIASAVMIQTALRSSGSGILFPGFDLGSGRSAQLSNGYVPYPYVPPGPTVQYADEIQILGKALDDKLSYTAGSFNSRSGQRGPHPINCTTSFGALSCSGGATSNGTTNGLYAQGTYDLGALVDGLSFTGGYRWNWDRIYSQNDVYSLATTGATQTAVRNAAASGSGIAYFQAPSFSMSLDYQLDPQTLVYISDNKSYAKGGFNPFSVPPQVRSFQPETLHMQEVGFKTDQDVMGWKARANMAFYYGDYEKIQATQSFFIAATNSSTQATGNAAAGYSEGIDGEFTIIPDPSIEFYLNVAYNHTAYETYPSIDIATLKPIDLSSQRPLVAPALKYVAHITYHIPIQWMAPGEDLGDLSITPSYDWISVTNHSQGLNLTLASHEWYPDYGEVDLSVNWHNMFGRAGLDGTFFATNLNDNVWTQATNTGFNNTGLEGMVPAAPRMMGVTLKYSFGPK